MAIDKIKYLNNIDFSSEDKLAKYWLAYFILWPFFTFLYAIRNFRHPKSKIIFWFFCIFFGLVFIYDVPFLGGRDSAYYAGELINTYEKSMTFENFRSMLYNPETGNIDLYSPVVIWLIALITNEPKFLFMVFAAVFGYFYTKNIWMILEYLRNKISVLLFLFLMVFALINPIWNINGVRMWTAAQIFLYGNLRYFLLEDKRGLIWCISSVFIHFSFISPVFILVTYLFLPYKNIYVFFTIYIFTAFFSELDLVNLKNFLSFLPDFVQPRVNVYLNEDRAVSIGLIKVSWHVVFVTKFLKWIIYIWLFLLFLNRELIKNKFPEFFRLFLFALILGSFANLASYIPSGGRFQVLSNSLFLALFIVLLSNVELKTYVNVIRIITVPFLILVILFNLRMGLDYVGILTFIGNPIIAFFFEIKTPIIFYIKQLIG